MIKGNLMMAADFAKKKDVPHEQVSHRTGEQWYVVSRGPGYSNTYKVTEYDEEGLAWLQAHEEKEVKP